MLSFSVHTATFIHMFLQESSSHSSTELLSWYMFPLYKEPVPANYLASLWSKKSWCSYYCERHCPCLEWSFCLSTQIIKGPAHYTSGMALSFSKAQSNVFLFWILKTLVEVLTHLPGRCCCLCVSGSCWNIGKFLENLPFCRFTKTSPCRVTAFSHCFNLTYISLYKCC